MKPMTLRKAAIKAGRERFFTGSPAKEEQHDRLREQLITKHTAGLKNTKQLSKEHAAIFADVYIESYKKVCTAALGYFYDTLEKDPMSYDRLIKSTTRELKKEIKKVQESGRDSLNNANHTHLLYAQDALSKMLKNSRKTRKRASPQHAITGTDSANKPAEKVSENTHVVAETSNNFAQIVGAPTASQHDNSAAAALLMLSCPTWQGNHANSNTVSAHPGPSTK